MKYLLALLMFYSVSSQAQMVDSTNQTPGQAQKKLKMRVMRKDPFSSKGFRFSFFVPNLGADQIGSESLADLNVQSNQPFLRTEKKSNPTFLGVSGGYAYMPIQSLGWTTNLAYMGARQDGATINIFRVDGNLGYAFMRELSLKGGVNFAKIDYSNNNSNNYLYSQSKVNFDPGYGFQAQLTYQPFEYLGFDLGYSEINAAAKTKTGYMLTETSTNLKVIQGLEIGVHGTF